MNAKVIARKPAAAAVPERNYAKNFVDAWRSPRSENHGTRDDSKPIEYFLTLRGGV
ncbi:hypothetical protein [Rhodohalobacter sp. 614A]|uniref:hypothetical protein n=1 Tax=Rhodohalobacter sp. 614A TaxID=2908649 RepID=UPI001F3D177A|nr:hypothetical protein [Rhodohalobacter sp. 614A]